MEKKTIQIILEISIILFFLLLMGLLAYSLFYNKEVVCNARLEFKKIGNCTQECINNCVAEGFDSGLNHTLLGEKISISKSNNGIIKESKCLCECSGCKK